MEKSEEGRNVAQKNTLIAMKSVFHRGGGKEKVHETSMKWNNYSESVGSATECSGGI